jgi:hypothetical protein
LESDDLSLKKWCNAKDENIVEEIARFENMILEEGARLKAMGEKGLEILPGAQKLLDSVCDYCDSSKCHWLTIGADTSGRLDYCHVWYVSSAESQGASTYLIFVFQLLSTTLNPH